MPIVAITSITDSCINVMWHHRKTRHDAFIRWQAIESIHVFKRDLFVHDLLCMHIATADRVYEIDEEDGYWQTLSEQLPTALPSCTPWASWFMDVAFPAFETNRTQIYSRSAALALS